MNWIANMHCETFELIKMLVVRFPFQIVNWCGCYRVFTSRFVEKFYKFRQWHSAHREKCISHDVCVHWLPSVSNFKRIELFKFNWNCTKFHFSSRCNRANGNQEFSVNGNIKSNWLHSTKNKRKCHKSTNSPSFWLW